MNTENETPEPETEIKQEASGDRPSTPCSPAKRPFEHYCQWGTIFRCETSDLSTPMVIHGNPKNEMHFASDVAEMVSFHAFNIWPTLNGFQGYDCVEFRLANVKEHAPLSVGASVDHGVEVKTREDHVNREADRGCCVSSCSLSVIRGDGGCLEFWDSKANIHWVDHRSLIGGINVRTYADGNLHVSLEGDVGEITEEVMNRLKRVLFGILPPVDIPLKRETTSGIWPLEHVQKQLR